MRRVQRRLSEPPSLGKTMDQIPSQHDLPISCITSRFIRTLHWPFSLRPSESIPHDAELIKRKARIRNRKECSICELLERALKREMDMSRSVVIALDDTVATIIPKRLALLWGALRSLCTVEDGIVHLDLLAMRDDISIASKSELLALTEYSPESSSPTRYSTIEVPNLTAASLEIRLYCPS